MKIANLTFYKVDLPLKRRIKHATFSRSESTNFVARCRLENGVTGYGEGVPRDYVTGEILDASFMQAATAELGVFDHSCSSLKEAVDLCDALSLSGPAARCAGELAILDAYCRHFGSTFAEIVHLVVPELFRPMTTVRYGGVVTSEGGINLAMQLLAQRLYGLQQIKVKVGGAIEDDCRRVAAAVRCFGGAAELRVDVNGGWNASQVVDHLRRLEVFPLAWVEQPFADRDKERFAGITTRVRQKVYLDESVCSLADARLAVDLDLCHGINLRLSKCGGLIPTLRLAAYAFAQGLEVQLGCQVGESPLLSAAGRHLACSLRGLTAVEGSYDRYLLRRTFTASVCGFGYGGRAIPLSGPGIGVDVDEAVLGELATDKIERPRD